MRPGPGSAPRASPATIRSRCRSRSTRVSSRRPLVGDPEEGLTYAEAGVDIDEGEHAVDLIRPLVASTHREGVVGGIRGLGGLFVGPTDRYPEPLLVPATDRRG